MGARGAGTARVARVERAAALPPLLLLLLLLVYPVQSSLSKTRQEGLSTFFNAMDEDGDGQIQEDEASNYLAGKVGGESFDTAKEIRQGVASFMHLVDSGDAGRAVSEAELEKHLASDRLMSAAAVERWVVHALQLPQYADAFRRNAITALDFPMLVTDPTSLEDDLGIRSSLHRTQISRALKWHILGVGVAPAAPESLTCKALSGGKIALHWSDPEQVGLPPFHSYTLLRRTSPTEAWHSITVNGELDGYEDADVERRQTYTYRLVLWGLYGDSPGTEVSGCRAGAGKSKATTNKAHAVAAGATATGATAQAEGGWAYPLFMSALMVVLPLMVRNQQLWGAAGAWLGASLPASANAAPVTEAELAAAAGEEGEEKRDNQWLAESSRRLSFNSFAPEPMPSVGAAVGPTPSLSRSQSQQHERSTALVAGGLRRPSSYGNLGERVMGAASPRPAAGSLGTTPRDGSAVAARDMREMSPTPENGFIGSSRARHERSGSDGYNSQGESHAALSTPVSARRTRVIANGLAHYRHYSSGSENEDFFELVHTQPIDDVIDPRVDTPPQHLRDAPRNRCAHEGCDARWDRFKLKDMRTAFGRHYCRQCQLAYCQKHTRISPHGPHGSCGQETQCYCEPCFLELPPEARQAVELTNKLEKGGIKLKSGWPSLGRLRRAGLTKLRRNASQSSMRSGTSGEASDHDDPRGSPSGARQELNNSAQLPPLAPLRNPPRQPVDQ